MPDSTFAKADLRLKNGLAHYIMNPNVKTAVFLDRHSLNLIVKIILQLPLPCLEALALSSPMNVINGMSGRRGDIAEDRTSGRPI